MESEHSQRQCRHMRDYNRSEVQHGESYQHQWRMRYQMQVRKWPDSSCSGRRSWRVTKISVERRTVAHKSTSTLTNNVQCTYGGPSSERKDRQLAKNRSVVATRVRPTSLRFVLVPALLLFPFLFTCCPVLPRSIRCSLVQDPPSKSAQPNTDPPFSNMIRDLCPEDWDLQSLFLAF